MVAGAEIRTSEGDASFAVDGEVRVVGVGEIGQRDERIAVAVDDVGRRVRSAEVDGGDVVDDGQSTVGGGEIDVGSEIDGGGVLNGQRGGGSDVGVNVDEIGGIK